MFGLCTVEYAAKKRSEHLESPPFARTLPKKLLCLLFTTVCFIQLPLLRCNTVSALHTSPAHSLNSAAAPGAQGPVHLGPLLLHVGMFGSVGRQGVAEQRHASHTGACSIVVDVLVGGEGGAGALGCCWFFACVSVAWVVVVVGWGCAGGEGGAGG